MENQDKVRVVAENNNESSKYERFVRNFDLLDSLYKNQGVSKQKMLEILEEMHENLYEFINTLDPKNKHRKMAIGLYAEIHSYIVNVKNDNVAQY